VAGKNKNSSPAAAQFPGKTIKTDVLGSKIENRFPI